MGKRFAEALARLVSASTAVEKAWRRADTRLLVSAALVPRHRIKTRLGELVFVSTHSQALQYPRDFETREPETLAWIESFEPPCRFWDIGANIGVFALYAGLRPSVEVLAFEPAAASYAGLCRNIAENGLEDRVQGYCVAMSDRTQLGRLNLSGMNAGSVFNGFDSVEDCFGDPITVVCRQAAVSFSVDDFRRSFGLPAPNYLKIDVDGAEPRILGGARETLGDPELRSVLIELEAAETARNKRLISCLEAAGFSLAARSKQPQQDVVNGIFIRTPVSPTMPVPVFVEHRR